MLEIFVSVPLQAGVLTLAILAAIYIYIKSSYSYWTKLGIPIYNPVIPFGNFGEMVFKNIGIQSQITKLHKTFEGHKLGGLYGFGLRFLLVRDPDLIRDIIVKDFDHFHDRGLNVSENGDPLDLHLFSQSGATWRKLRVKISPTFTSGKMKMMFGALVDCRKELYAVLQEQARKGETLEIKDILARFTTDVIASCAFGIQCNCLRNPDAEFRNWGRKIFEVTYKMKLFRFANIVMPSLIKRFGLSFVPRDVSNYFRKMVRETVDYREKNGIQRNDFMHLMIQLKNKTLTTSNEDASKYGESELDAVDSKEFGTYNII
jgi:cytochrome P450 family 6